MLFPFRRRRGCAISRISAEVRTYNGSCWLERGRSTIPPRPSTCDIGKPNQSAVLRPEKFQLRLGLRSRTYQRGYGFTVPLFNGGYLPRHHIYCCQASEEPFGLPGTVRSQDHFPGAIFLNTSTNRIICQGDAPRDDGPTTITDER